MECTLNPANNTSSQQRSGYRQDKSATPSIWFALHVGTHITPVPEYATADRSEYLSALASLSAALLPGSSSILACTAHLKQSSPLTPAFTPFSEVYHEHTQHT
jgi:hypothetical protein